MRRRRRVRAGERGAALLLALVLLVLVETAALLIAVAAAADAREARRQAARTRLDRLVESAAEATLARLAEGDESGLEPTALGGGTLTSAVERLAPGRFRILARARREGAARTLVVEALYTPGGVRILAWRPGALRAAGGG